MRTNYPTLKDRFFERYIPEPMSGCWLWIGSTSVYGYGYISITKNKRGIARRTAMAHRLSWEFHKGPIPDGMYVCHKCDIRACVNPSHLFLGTHQDNMDDMVRKGRAVSVLKAKTHCKYGHELSGDNLSKCNYALKKNVRICVACSRIRANFYYRNKKKR